MLDSNRYSPKIFFGILAFSFLGFACQDTLESEALVYENDFSDLDLANFENARLAIFESDTVVGYYNNEEVSLTVPNLPGHNILKITVEILVHDTWDGNPSDGSGPDIWYMKVDGNEIFRTTFSNSPCESTYCLRQSYPNDYFRQNDPKSGAVQTNLPGLCVFGAFENYTTRYSISRLVSHNSSTVKITLGDELKSTYVEDPACDESWSLAKIVVTSMVVI
jgi:hypothetical protein